MMKKKKPKSGIVKGKLFMYCPCCGERQNRFNVNEFRWFPASNCEPDDAVSIEVKWNCANENCNVALRANLMFNPLTIKTQEEQDET